MDLPELRNHLAKFLRNAELAAATAVCKSWYETFTPHLYREIQWTDYTRNPSRQAIEANAQHIRSLFIHAAPWGFPLEALTKVQAIFLGFRVQGLETWRRLATLLKQNPEMESVTVATFGRESLIEEFMSVLASACPKLHTLVCNFDELDENCTAYLLDASVRVKALSLCDVELVPPDSLDRWPVFLYLEHLEMSIYVGLSPDQQCEVMRRSPQLRTLGWYLDCGKTSISPLKDIIADHCRHLHELELIDGKLSDREISQILDSFQRLTKLRLVDSEFHSKAQQSLTRHHPHLKELDVGRCRGTTSAMTQQIMISCPELVHLYTERLDAQDILGSAALTHADDMGEKKQETYPPVQDWVCTGLRTLSTFVGGLEGKPQAWHRMVMRQLASLRKLESFIIGISSFNKDKLSPRDGLDLRLQAGLNSLHGLSIQEFNFDGLWQQMEEHDVRWFTEAWPRLSSMLGMMHHDSERCIELQTILQARNITIRKY
ncbi:MAG: hypothetical protein J3Q66DRAFT_134751 [Benniella sp.]|nr:MAG: hypothetical protein J3Q66DRAFT_134751 [Benniella sp.]